MKSAKLKIEGRLTLPENRSPIKVNLVSLGCAKNLVDSEIMLAGLAAAGMQITDDPSDADIIIVNTCSFIETAVNESIDHILELADYKNSGRCGRLIVTGCLPQRYGSEISQSLPEVDIFLGTAAFDQIVEMVQGDIQPPICRIPPVNQIRRPSTAPARINTVFPIAYLKIAEGCDRRCTYCIIPKLRGKQKSAPVNVLLEEFRQLIESGAREIILVAQESTNYGADLTGGENLSILLDRLSNISNDVRIRFLYAHPESITENVIDLVAEKNNIVPYFDIPIQHSETGMLKKMGRRYSKDRLYRLFEAIRSKIPDAALRTTVMSGFPGETHKDFQNLINFIKEVRFDHLGGFVYSDAEELASYRLSPKTTAKTAEKRLDELMAVQMEISLEHNRRRLGGIFEVLVEKEIDDDLYQGRTAFQAPDVDGVTCIQARTLAIGSFINVQINDISEYDLYGEPA